MTPFGRSLRSPLAIPIGDLFGIPIRAHWTFPLVLFWVGALTAEQGVGFGIGALLTVLLFACVVVHELGHALVARRFAVDTHEIVLYPVGGAARLTRCPEGVPELAIALGGPATNLGLAGILTVVLFGAGLPFRPELSMAPAPLLSDLILANAGLFLINLVPAFPLDGGRVVRALLSLQYPTLKATAVAAMIGQGLAVVVGVVGVAMGSILLVLAALLVFFGAGQEAGVHRRQAILDGRTAREAMVTRFETLAPQQPVEQAARLLLRSPQRAYPVVDAWGRVRGLVRRREILAAFAGRGRRTPVMEIMDREVSSVTPETGLMELELSRSPILVQEGDELLGLVTPQSVEDLAALLLAQTAGR